MFIWKKVPPGKAPDKVTVMVLVGATPLHETDIVGGSIIVQDKLPLAIEVVGGTIISNLPPALMEVIVVEYKDKVVVALTVLVALSTPTLAKVAAFVFDSKSDVVMINSMMATKW